MKNAALLVMLVVAAARVSAQSPATPDGAILNCDTAVKITAVDGDSSRKFQNHGYAGEDCAIPLTQGRHVIDVCYSLHQFSSDYRLPIPATCKEVKKVEVNAEAGHVYRVKLVLDDPWLAWIVDVTDIEAALPAKEAQVNKSLKKKVPKAERKSIVILKLNPKPLDSTVSVTRGGTLGIWFGEDVFYTPPLFKTADPQGFSLLELSIGDTFALQSISYPDKNVFGGWGGAGPCGDSYFPVFEDIPGGKALYLGHFDFQKTWPRPVLSFDQDDFEEARAWLEKEKPGLGTKLEVMPFRWARTSRLCNLGRLDAHFVNAPGQP